MEQKWMDSEKKMTTELHINHIHQSIDKNESYLFKKCEWSGHKKLHTYFFQLVKNLEEKKIVHNKVGLTHVLFVKNESKKQQCLLRINYSQTSEFIYVPTLTGSTDTNKKKENTNNYSLGNSCAWHTDPY
ncbi:hypothetical protein ACJX0J_013394 [Zea mays]